MRFVGTFTALALAGTFSSVSAGPCRPASSSATISSASPTSTSGHGSGPIVNDIVGGDFRRRSNTPSGISNFNVEGQGNHVENGGYTGGGSNEGACASLAASTDLGPGKRELGQYAAISQQLTNLEVGTAYTVQFFYAVQSSSQSGACRIEVSFGASVFTSTPYFSSSNSPSSWASSTVSTNIQVTQGQMRFALTCSNGGSAQVYIDSIFVSNQVTPKTINNADLVFDAASTETSTVASNDAVSSDPVTETSTEEGNTSETSPASEATSEEQGTFTTETSTESASEEERTSVAATATETGDEATSATETGTDETTTAQETTSSVKISETSTEAGETSSETLAPTSTTPTSTQRIYPSGVSAPGGCYVPDEVPGTPTCFDVGFVSGVVDVQYQDMKTPVNDWHICADACAAKSGCLSFGYDAQEPSKWCALYASKLDWSFSKMQRGLTWSEMDCIKCVECDEDASGSFPTETAVAAADA